MTLTTHLVKTVSNRLGTPETTTIGTKFVNIGAIDYETWLFPHEIVFKRITHRVKLLKRV